MSDMRRVYDFYEDLWQTINDLFWSPDIRYRDKFICGGSPIFFVTVNPDDLKHSLMLSIWCTATGSRVDVPMSENFVRYHQKRLQILSQDPVLQALFFNIIFCAVIDVLFGFDRNPRVGILGEVSAHDAIIEAKGKGTLHAHGLIWLTDGNKLQFLHLILSYYCLIMILKEDC